MMISSLYDVSYDESAKVVDFISKKKTSAKRLAERQITFRVVNDCYKLHSFTFDGLDVDASWFEQTLAALSSGPTPSKFSAASAATAVATDDAEQSNKENVMPVYLVTPAEDDISSIKKRKKLSQSPATKLLGGSLCNAEISRETGLKVVEAYFEADLSSYVETTIKKSKSTSGEGGGGGAKISTSSSSSSSSSSTSSSSTSSSTFVPLLISLEGNIGAGKSFLLSKMRAEHPEWVFIDEPVDFWESLKNDEGESLLSMFYADQRRWSFTFQQCALLSRFQNIESCIAAKREEYERTGDAEEQVCVFVTERCLDTDHEVFAKMLVSDGVLSSLEFTLYQKWFALLEQTASPLSAIVFVDTEPNLCSERIIKRSREGEGGIPIEYLNNLHKFQTKWIDSTKIPVLRTLSHEQGKVDAFIAGVIREAKEALLSADEE